MTARTACYPKRGGNAMRLKYTYGTIFKRITGLSRIPKSTERIWDSFVETKEAGFKAHVNEYGSGLTICRGNVFENREYSFDDIDKRLK
jgi:hypothetical protein